MFLFFSIVLLSEIANPGFVILDFSSYTWIIIKFIFYFAQFLHLTGVCFYCSTDASKYFPICLWSLCLDVWHSYRPLKITREQTPPALEHRRSSLREGHYYMGQFAVPLLLRSGFWHATSHFEHTHPIVGHKTTCCLLSKGSLGMPRLPLVIAILSTVVITGGKRLCYLPYVL